ncbi:MAG: hypothetical protein EAZ57_05035 [Cytophagales bacterium]|nr:MAG: hypothetical protein EAZ67_00845 [Cytophagales bacterium]TAF61169.1 MAG: hypothetical protein EAZ57_05035 [Cytophagales bacterium]
MPFLRCKGAKVYNIYQILEAKKTIFLKKVRLCFVKAL